MHMMIFLHKDHEDQEYFNRKKKTKGIAHPLSKWYNINNIATTKKRVSTIHIPGKPIMENCDKINIKTNSTHKELPYTAISKINIVCSNSKENIRVK